MSGRGESVVVTRTVRLIAPFVFTFGLFAMFHGADGVGGGFQGGVVVASAVVTIAFGFGVERTAAWLDRTVLTAVAVGGVLTVAAVALGPALYGAGTLDLAAYPGEKGALYAIEAIEVGIGAAVAATVVLLFVDVAAGPEVAE